MKLNIVKHNLLRQLHHTPIILTNETLNVSFAPRLYHTHTHFAIFYLKSWLLNLFLLKDFIFTNQRFA